MKPAFFYLVATLFVVPSIGVRILPPEVQTKEVDSGDDTCPSQQVELNAVNDVKNSIDDLLDLQIVPNLDCRLGQCETNPATSCNQILEESIGNNGWYWIRRCDNVTVQVYCAMNNPCGCSGTGAWMRVAYLNMSDPNQMCPHGQTIVPDPRSCSRNVQPGACTSAYYSPQLMDYSRVCGRITAYGEASPDAFRPYNDNRGYTIDDPYVDGVSLTYGFSPRKHIWTFAAGVTDTGSDTFRCPCSSSNWPGVLPPYIENDWFCEAGPLDSWQRGQIYSDNPLWDGTGCQGAESTCCTTNNPPWFCKELPTSSNDNIEVRSCGDQHQNDENVLLALYEIYVQ